MLVVDDEAAGLVAMQSVLESSDRRLVLAQSGRDALRLMLTEDFAVVLLDVRMPDIDGLERDSTHHSIAPPVGRHSNHLSHCRLGR